MATQTFTGSVYLIINKENNKKYVGQTTKTVQHRWINHCTTKSGTKLYDAIQKYGKDSFKVITLKCFACSDLETLHKQLDYWECWYIQYYNSYKEGYNCTTGGVAGYEFSDEIKDKISKSQIGVPKPNHTEEWKNNMRETMKQRTESGNNKLINNNIKKPVDQYSLDGMFIKTWESCSEVKKYFNLDSHNSHIGMVCNGKRKSCYGYIWKWHK